MSYKATYYEGKTFQGTWLSGTERRPMNIITFYFMWLNINSATLLWTIERLETEEIRHRSSLKTTMQSCLLLVICCSVTFHRLCYIVSFGHCDFDSCSGSFVRIYNYTFFFYIPVCLMLFCFSAPFWNRKYLYQTFRVFLVNIFLINRLS